MLVFQFGDYRDYLRHVIHENRGTRGYQTRMAQAAGCQRAFISQVLSGPVNLTPDHAAGLCAMWGFGEEETDFFIDLLQFARSATPQLRAVYSRRMARIKKQRTDLTSRLKKSTSLSAQWQSIYYSNWHYSAVHVVASIPGINTPAAVARRLGIPIELAGRTLDSLGQMGLLKGSGGSWSVVEHDLFLPKQSHLTAVNHLNWRQRAISDIQQGEERSLHFTTISALSHKDVERLKELLIGCIAETGRIIAPSPEEEIVCLSCDLFAL